jgi:hypothetical protein
MTRVLVVLSGQPAETRAILASARARFPDAEVTVVLRAPCRDALEDLLAGAHVVDDKPAGRRAAFVAALRRERFDHGVVAWTGSWSHWPSKVAFALARVTRREIATERGTVPFGTAAIVRHLAWRAKAPIHPTAGMPAGIPWPIALCLAAFRATLGRLLGPLVVAVRAVAQR